MKNKLSSTSILIFTLIALGCGFYNHANAQTINTIAGTGSGGFSGDGGSAITAQLNHPRGVAYDVSGNIYIADELNNRIRKITATGVMSTVAGNGSASFGGDGGQATAAQLNHPYGVAVDKNGNLYIADMGNTRIRKVTPAGIISTVGGTGTFGYSGDGTPATTAKIGRITGIAVDTNANVFIADYLNDCIRKINTSGIISTFAGTGTAGFAGDGGPATSALLSYPNTIACDTLGNLYIQESFNNRIRKVSVSGIINTIAGIGSYGYTGDGGPATAAELAQTYSIAADFVGNVYFTDLNHLRKIDTAGIITTIAGDTTYYYHGDGVSATDAGMDTACYIAVDVSRSVFMADCPAHYLRKINGCDLPVVAPITGAASVCTGTTISLNDTTAAGTWLSSNAARATISATGVVTGVSAGTLTITYTVTNSCGTRLVTTPITVIAPPTAGTVTGSTSYCATATASSTLTAAGATTGGTWVSGSTSIATISSTGVVTPILSGADTMYYVIANACGSDTSSIAITVHPVAVAATTSGFTSVCAGGATITLTGGGSFAGTWSVSATSIATINTTTGVLTGVTAGTVTVTYTVTSSFGCGSSYVTRTITVNPLPSGGTIAGVAVACIGGYTTVTDAVSGGTWSMTNSRAYVSTTGDVHGSSLGLDTVVYTVVNGCGIARAYFPMTIDTVPHVATISGTTTICAGATTTLGTSIGGGAWSLTDTSIAHMSGAVFTSVVAGVDTVIYRLINYCGSSIARYPVTALPILTPGVNISVSPDDSICEGNNATYNPIPLNGGSTPRYQWKKFGAVVDTHATYTYVPSNGDVITVTMKSSYQCPLPDSAVSPAVIMVVNTIVTPSDSITTGLSGDTATYVGQTVTCFSTISFCGATPMYQWYRNGLAVPGATNYLYTHNVYSNDTVFCVIHCSSHCTTKSVDTSNTLIIYADYLLLLGVPHMGIDEKRFSLFPNPNSGSFTFSGKIDGSNDAPVQYELIDILGKVCYTGTTLPQNNVVQEQINIGDALATGKYLLRIRTSDHVEVLHIVIK